MDETTKLLSNKKTEEQAKTIINETAKSSKLPKILKTGALAAAGLAVGGAGVFALMGMTPPTPVDENGEAVDLSKPEIPAEPQEATGITDDMSFGEAFKAARADVGAGGFFEWHGKVYGTMYETEMAQLSPEEQKEMYGNIMEAYTPDAKNDVEEIQPSIVVHEEAPIAVGVSDDMSFKDAWAVARAEVGPGGVFSWNGDAFNTYTKEEYNAMNDEQKMSFLESTGADEIQLATIGNEDVDIVGIDNQGGEVETIPALAESTENLLAEDIITDPDTGMTYKVAMFEIDGEQVIKVDTDNDGTYDTSLAADESGNILMTTADGETQTITEEDIVNYQNATFEADVYTDDVSYDVNLDQTLVDDFTSSDDFDNNTNVDFV